jgi:hypothetical protein
VRASWHPNPPQTYNWALGGRATDARKCAARRIERAGVGRRTPRPVLRTAVFGRTTSNLQRGTHIEHIVSVHPTSSRSSNTRLLQRQRAPARRPKRTTYKDCATRPGHFQTRRLSPSSDPFPLRAGHSCAPSLAGDVHMLMHADNGARQLPRGAVSLPKRADARAEDGDGGRPVQHFWGFARAGRRCRTCSRAGPSTAAHSKRHGDRN